MANGSPNDTRWSRRHSGLVFGLIILVFLGRPLLGLGSLLPIDIVDGAAPWSAGAQPAQSPDNPFLSDTLDVHTHFAAVADDIRSGTGSWWDRSVGAGIPTLKAGFSPLMWLYLLVPAWYAPGLVAAVRTLLAAVLTYGLIRELRAGRAAATLGGVAYCLSGFMVGWAGWPQSNVAAFLPGLFWAVERLVRRPGIRRAVPIALVVAAMLVSNFPVVTAYGLLAAAGYGFWRVWTTADSRAGLSVRVVALGRPALIAGWGLLLAGLLGSLHILAFGEYFDWADTSARERIEADTSIGADYLLSIPLPRPFGASHTGAAFWGEGQNWVETQSYAGLAVVLLAVVALAARTRRRGGTGDIAARASAVRALWGVTIVGAWVTYVGGIPTELIQSLPLLGQNAVGRARVVINLALAVLSGLGLQVWLDARDGAPGIDLRRGRRVAVIGVGAAGLLSVPMIWRWADGARDRGLVVETMQSMVVPLAAASAVVGVLWWYRPSAGRRSGEGALSTSIVLVVAVELLIFAVPVATVVDRDRANLSTPAHQAVIEILDPGERIGADARTFFANTGQVTGVDDMRGHLLTPAGWRELYRAVDPDHFRPPGSVTNPWFENANIQSLALDRMAVGVWAADPRRVILGSREIGAVANGSVTVDAATGPVAGVATMEVPEGGLRAITVQVLNASAQTLRAVVTVDGRTYEGFVELGLTPPREGIVAGGVADVGFVDIGFVGIAAPPGSTIDVTFSAGGSDEVLLGTTDSAVTFATVAADDRLRLVRAGDVLLYERLSAAPARLVFAVNVSDEPVGAAVHAGSLGQGVGVIASNEITGLPNSVPDGADGSAVVRSAEGGTVIVDIETTARAMVVISQPSYPGWSAEVDGRATTVIEVDGAFPGVRIEPGRHVVTLRYSPTDLSLAGILSALGVCGLFGSWWVGRPRRG